jgi:hypothetical protein
LYDKSDCHANALLDAWPPPGLRPLAGTFRTFGDVRLESVTRNKADISQRYGFMDFTAALSRFAGPATAVGNRLPLRPADRAVD